MPKRNNVITKNSEEVQGDGSFITVKRITLDEARDYQAIVQRQAPPVNDWDEDFDNDEYNELLKQFNDTKEFDARKCVSQFVLAWNWVDDQDKPFDPPHNNPEVLGKLTDQEFLFILSTLNSPNSEKKKK